MAKRRRYTDDRDYTPDPSNANKGTERGQYMIDTSVESVGLARSIVAANDDTIPAGNKTLQAALDAGIEDVIEVETDGNALVVVKRTDWPTVDSEAARKYAYLDNRASEVGLAWDAEQVLADLDAGVDLSGMFLDDELDTLLAEVDGYDSALGVEKGAQPNPRQLPIDVIITAGVIGKTALDECEITNWACCLAVRSGLQYGIQSTGSGGVCVLHDKMRGHEVAFIDNDYFNYDHDIHVEAIEKWRPKYATVCDVMTREQCAKDEIAFYELEQILEWAEELSEHAENVIVIPKWDCIDRIPEKFMLGFSVPTSHGGTPLPTSAFEGRRVHLLGGSWSAQLAHMAALGDDVVSIDNNYIFNMARFGQFTRPDGTTAQVAQDLDMGYATNPRWIALAISFGAIGAKVNELYAGSATPA
jgi:hypothetical protein